jgi:hypothetical protein
VSEFVLDRGEHPECGVASAAVGEHLEVLEQGVGQLEAGAASPLAGRPYDLRHAAVSLWLNGGVPAPEVAERAGHSVDVLLKVYAKCIDGQRETVNKTIEGLFDE